MPDECKIIPHNRDAPLIISSLIIYNLKVLSVCPIMPNVFDKHPNVPMQIYLPYRFGTPDITESSFSPNTTFFFEW